MVGKSFTTSINEHAGYAEHKKEQEENREIFEHFEVQIDSDAELLQLTSPPSLVGGMPSCLRSPYRIWLDLPSCCVASGFQMIDFVQHFGVR
jgi:hypothetical protein